MPKFLSHPMPFVCRRRPAKFYIGNDSAVYNHTSQPKTISVQMVDVPKKIGAMYNSGWHFALLFWVLTGILIYPLLSFSQEELKTVEVIRVAGQQVLILCTIEIYNTDWRIRCCIIGTYRISQVNAVPATQRLEVGATVRLYPCVWNVSVNW